MKRKIALLLTVFLTAGSLPLGTTATESGQDNPPVQVLTEENGTEENNTEGNGTEGNTSEGNTSEGNTSGENGTVTDPAPAEGGSAGQSGNENEGTGNENTDPAAGGTGTETPGTETPGTEIPETETPEVEIPKTPGWYLESDGWHNYYNATENGQSVVKERMSEWFVPSSKTTIKDGSDSMVLNAKSTYYFDENGALAVGRQVDTIAYKKEMTAAPRFFNYKGLPVTGYAFYEGKLHYIEKKKGLFRESMVNLSKASTYTIYKEDGTTQSKKLSAGKRYFDADGVMVTGEAKTKSNGVQYFNADGINKTGYIAKNGVVSYFNASSGKDFDKFETLSKATTITDVSTGKKISLAKGKRYFNAEGAMVTGVTQTKSNGIQYFTSAGINKTGHISDKGVLHFYGTDTGMARNRFVTLSKATTITDVSTGKKISLAAGRRYFDDNGNLLKGEYQTKSNGIQYSDSAGLSRTGYVPVNGVLYFYEASTGKVTNASRTLNKDTTVTDAVTGKSVKIVKGTRFFTEDGTVQTGWYPSEEDKSRYYNSQGLNQTGYISVGGSVYYVNGNNGILKEASHTLKKKTTIKDQTTGKSITLNAGTRFFGPDGVMRTGWYPSEEEKSFFYNNAGLRQTGYILVDGSVYYVNASSGILKEASHTLDKDTTLTDQKTGKSLKLVKGTRFFGEDGVMRTGWYPSEEEKSFFYNSAGLRQTGYVLLDGSVYYVNASGGILREASHTLDKDTTVTDQKTGKSLKLAAGTRFFGEDGVMRTGWYPSEEEKEFYYSAEGLQQTGHISVNGQIFFAYSKTGLLRNASSSLDKEATITDQVTGKSVKLSAGKRYFGEDGVMVTGWYPGEEEKEFYFNDNGVSQTGYVSVGGDLYYIDPENGLLRNGRNTLTKDQDVTDQVTGRTTSLTAGDRYFDEDGHLVHGEHETEKNGTQYSDTLGNAQYGYVYYDGSLHYIDQERGKLRNEVNNDIDGLKDVVNQDSPTAYVRLTPGARYFDENGNAVTGGYHEIDALDKATNKHYYGTMYFFDDGAMAFRFTRLDGQWKYFRKEGGMVAGGDFDFSYEGEALSKPTSGGAYSFDGGTYFHKGHYFFDENGVMQTGLQQVTASDGSTKTYFYSDSTGRRADSGWVLAGGKWYLLNDDGSAVTDSEGQLLTAEPTAEGFLKDPRDGKTYMVDDKGAFVYGWQKVGNHWYHFNETTGVLDAQAESLNNTFCKMDDKVYYFGKDGKAVTDWQKINGHWYYFDKKGVRQDNTTVFGVAFDENGIATKAGFGGPNGKNGAASVTDNMIEMIKMAQTRDIKTNPTKWYAFTDKDHCQAGFFHYEGGAWVLQLYCPVSVGAWQNGKSKTPTGRYKINEKRYRMTHLTSFYYVSWTGAGVGYHTPLYDIKLKTITASTKPCDPVIGGSGGHRSNGCMRLHYANAVWQYNKLPVGTWVWMYGK